MARTRAIILSEYLTDARDLYVYLKSRVPPDVKVVLVGFDARRYATSPWYRLTYHLFHKILQVGLWQVACGLFKKQNIVVSSGASRFYKMICGKVIFLNHGWGTKKTPGNAERADQRVMRNYRAWLKNTDVVICLSEFDSTYYMVCSELSQEKRPAFLPLGLPRNDYLVKNAKDVKLRHSVEAQLEIPANWRIVLFAPTHREGVERNRQLISKILEEMSLIDNRLGEEKIILLFRPHYYEEGVKEHVAKLKHVRYVGYDVWRDPRDLMITSSALITDYSSIFVDYLLLDKPIIFRVGDLEEYMKYRGLVIDYHGNVHTPGKKINSLIEFFNIEWEKKENIKEARKFFYKYPDGNATERIGNYLLNEI